MQTQPNYSWLRPSAPQPTTEAHLDDGPRGNRASQTGTSPPKLLDLILKRVRISDHWVVPPGGAPSHRRSLLTEALLDGHLNGGHRVGACPIERGQNTTRLALFDLDSHGGEVDWSTMCGVASEIIASAASHGLRAIPVRSSGGQGIHLLFMWNDPQDARSVRDLLGQVLDECGLKNGTRGVRQYEVEIFPKQNSVPAGGWGSMFVLPFAGKSVALDRSTLQEIDPGAMRLEASDPVPVVEPKPVRAPSSIEVPPEIADVQGALEAIDPNDYDYDGWLRLLFAVHAGTDGSEEGFAVFDAWSQRFKRYTREETEKQWRFARSKKDGGITVGTLFAEARKRGYVPLSQRPSAEGLEALDEKGEPVDVGAEKDRLLDVFTRGEQTDADCVAFHALPGEAQVEIMQIVDLAATEETMKTVRDAIERARGSAAPKVTAQALIEQLRSEPREQVIATWADRAARLPRTEAEEVVAEVERLTGIKPRKLAGALNEARASAAKEQARRAFEKKRAGRVEIEVEKGEVGSMSRAAERAIVARGVPGAYLNFAGTPVCVRVDQLPNTHLIDDGDASAPPVPQFKPFNDPLMRVTVEGAVIFVGYDVKGRPRREDVPPPVVAQMLQNPSDSVPKVSGLLAHPVVLPDGTLLAKDGLHERTGLYLHGARVDGLRPYTRAEAAEAVARLREGLFREFEFASALDALVALAGLFTAMHRRLMPSSPGLAVLASRQSSGKTTLARVIHLATTGHDMPVTTLSESTEELKKHLFALLLRSPEMVCVDNIADGYTFRSPALAAMMTTDVYCDRVLGQSENRQVRTNTFWVITGNNLSLGADEITRWMVCRLEPSMARPEERRFKHADVAQMVSRLRPQILRDVVGVVWGYLKSDQGAAPSSGSRYPVWDRLVRLPLIWAGAGDVAEVFAKNRESSPDEIAKAGLLSALYDLSDGAVFRAIDVKDWLQGSFAGDGVAVLPGGKHEAVRRLRAALAESRVKNADAPSTSSIGRVLNGSAGACVETERGPLRLARRGTKEATAWQVELRG